MEGQSIYTTISKRIGWNGSASIPTIAKAKKLLHQVRDEKSESAFEEVFSIHRFAPHSPDNDGVVAMNIIHEAFTVGTAYFK